MPYNAENRKTNLKRDSKLTWEVTQQAVFFSVKKD
ncbi:hypothetical protein Niako_0864 [Niastella koreensis GR20-10]|uniref:Uncharacterized protein n=1 Tax=Niastella koreensis (strain DSM 17620 / KACC 11465 / NBRC 106392 / GR20-10) TaxID=700598 RepID=G8TE52_NIAKG|nr:hypothetical protein Niako_0864 [Niastella koreensis GR20-10]